MYSTCGKEAALGIQQQEEIITGLVAVASVLFAVASALFAVASILTLW